MSTFNPYKEALGDPSAQRNATRQHWKGWCRRCNTEKPMKGGRVRGLKGNTPFRGGTVLPFVCAECVAKESAT